VSLNREPGRITQVAVRAAWRAAFRSTPEGSSRRWKDLRTPLPSTRIA
jgi:hypothetical protein